MSIMFTLEAADAAMVPYRLAARFIQAHRDEHLEWEPLIDRCTAHLQACLDVPASLARETAHHALADVEGRILPAYIDVRRSTSYLVHVVDPRSREVAMFTARELLQLAQDKIAAANAPMHCIDRGDDS